MRKGFSRKLVGQVGEFLVCAELGRRGLVATPIAGNVPDYDVIATDEWLTAVPVQVKTVLGGSWQFDGGKLLEIDYDPGTGRQTVRGLRDTTNKDLIYVFVCLGDGLETRDRYFLCTKAQFLRVVLKHYKAYLQEKGGRRPRSPQSTHVGLRVEHLAEFEGRWELIGRRLDWLRSKRGGALAS